MSKTTRLLASADPVALGMPGAPLSFHRPTPGEGPGPRRLRLDGADAFDLSFWCGTCPLVFERLEGSNRTLSSEALQGRLNRGLTSIDAEVQDAASALIPDGTYLPMLLRVYPKLVSPAGKGDYFAQEQLAHRGTDQFWGLPQQPKTQYYRGGSWRTDKHEFLFEFLVPMLPPAWNERARVAEYEAQLRRGSAPTVLALSVLDHTQPYNHEDAHSGLIHFILDGHHKIEAAARARAPITVMSFLSMDDSLAPREQLEGIARLIASGPKVLR